jgi:hypothetical protein
MSVTPPSFSKRILFDSGCRSAVFIAVFLSLLMNSGKYLKTNYDHEKSEAPTAVLLKVPAFRDVGYSLPIYTA